MKKVSLIVCGALVLANSLCFAEVGTSKTSNEKYQASATSAPTTNAMPSVMMVAGKIKSISVGDISKGTKPEITVTDAMGKDVALIVTPSTVISDSMSSNLTLDKVASGANVQVKYLMEKNGMTASAIKIKG